MTHDEFVQGLRNAADFFEARPELGVPYEPHHVFKFYGDVNGITVDSKEGLAEFVRIVGGKFKKEGNDYHFWVLAEREGFSVEAVAIRSQVCERVKTGSKIEPAHVVPAQPATEETYVPAREVPVYEYRCPVLTKPVEFAPEPPTIEGATPLQLEAEHELTPF